MNENSSTNTSQSAPHHGLTAEAISRRAYELWEKEGRPENRDLHHWLRAEQELLGEMNKGAGSSTSARTETPSRVGNTDQPMQGSRPAPVGSRDQKAPGRRSASPFPGDKTNRPAQPPVRQNPNRG